MTRSTRSSRLTSPMLAVATLAMGEDACGPEKTASSAIGSGRRSRPRSSRSSPVSENARSRRLRLPSLAVIMVSLAGCGFATQPSDVSAAASLGIGRFTVGNCDR